MMKVHPGDNGAVLEPLPDNARRGSLVLVQEKLEVRNEQLLPSVLEDVKHDVMQTLFLAPIHLVTCSLVTFVFFVRHLFDVWGFEPRMVLFCTVAIESFWLLAALGTWLDTFESYTRMQIFLKVVLVHLIAMIPNSMVFLIPEDQFNGYYALWFPYFPVCVMGFSWIFFTATQPEVISSLWMRIKFSLFTGVFCWVVSYSTFVFYFYISLVMKEDSVLTELLCAVCYSAFTAFAGKILFGNLFVWAAHKSWKGGSVVTSLEFLVRLMKFGIHTGQQVVIYRLETYYAFLVALWTSILAEAFGVLFNVKLIGFFAKYGNSTATGFSTTASTKGDNSFPRPRRKKPMILEWLDHQTNLTPLATLCVYYRNEELSEKLVIMVGGFISIGLNLVFPKTSNTAPDSEMVPRFLTMIVTEIIEDCVKKRVLLNVAKVAISRSGSTCFKPREVLQISLITFCAAWFLLHSFFCATLNGFGN